MNRLSFLRPAHRSLPIAAALMALAAPAAHATTLPVSNAAAFDQAIAQAKSGDTIQLAGTSFPQLLIRKRSFSSVVKIVGTPGATKLNGLVIKDSKNIELQNLSFSPTSGGRATLGLYHAAFITVDHVVFDGLTEDQGAGFNMSTDSSNVTVSNSE